MMTAHLSQQRRNCGLIAFLWRVECDQPYLPGDRGSVPTTSIMLSVKTQVGSLCWIAEASRILVIGRLQEQLSFVLSACDV
jgi:hypothetical protein